MAEEKARNAMLDMDAVLKFADKMRAGYVDLGYFMAEFSQLEFTIRYVLVQHLGLKEETANAVTAPYDFASLCRVTRFVLTRNVPDREKEIAEVFSACLELNDQRTHVAHGLWSMGETLEASHVSRQTFQSKVYFSKPGELRDLGDQAQKLFQQVLAVAFAAKQPTEAG